MSGPGIYVAAGVGEFFRDRALPLATIATPNAFELEWLTGEPVNTLQAARRAIAALRARGPRVVVATSLQLDDTPAGALDILAGDEAGLWRVRTPNLPISVNGSGDVFAALFFHHWLETHDTPRGAIARGVVGLRGREGHSGLGLARTEPDRCSRRVYQPVATFRRGSGLIHGTAHLLFLHIGA